MKESRKFLVNEMPFDALGEIGMEEKAFLDLPKQALEQIMTGNLSPLMEMKMRNADGQTVTFPAKFQLVREQDGSVGVRIHPVRKELDNAYQLTPEEIQRLEQQECVVKTIATKQGNQTHYIQMDKELNILFSQKTDNIQIPEAIGDITLGIEQKERIRQGKPIELEYENTKVTVGVDLNSRGGFRITDGDLGEWRQQKLEQWDRITPGVSGYWKTSENGWQYQKNGERLQQRETERTRTVEMSRGRGMGR